MSIAVTKFLFFQKEHWQRFERCQCLEKRGLFHRIFINAQRQTTIFECLVVKFFDVKFVA